MQRDVEVPEELKAFVREWCDGHHKRDPEGWPWNRYEGWQQDDMLAAAFDAFPALADAICSQEKQRVRETLLGADALNAAEAERQKGRRAATIVRAALDSLEDEGSAGTECTTFDCANRAAASAHVESGWHPYCEECAAVLERSGDEVRWDLPDSNTHEEAGRG